MLENYYHIYNRGAHKALLFKDQSDYERFVTLLYISNSKNPFRYNLIPPKDYFTFEREKILVTIVAYCLMPNHFHIAVKVTETEDLTLFMRKLCTAYSMYFNKKYKHSGTIFEAAFKEKLVETTEYLQTLITYIHLNPFSIHESSIQDEVKKEYTEQAFNYSKNYLYSSLRDYLGDKRPQNNILLGVTSQGYT